MAEPWQAIEDVGDSALVEPWQYYYPVASGEPWQEISEPLFVEPWQRKAITAADPGPGEDYQRRWAV